MPMCSPAWYADGEERDVGDEEQRHPRHEPLAVDLRREGAVGGDQHEQEQRLAGRRVALHLGAALAEDEDLARGLELVVGRQDEEHQRASSAARPRPRPGGRRRWATAGARRATSGSRASSPASLGSCSPLHRASPHRGGIGRTASQTRDQPGPGRPPTDSGKNTGNRGLAGRTRCRAAAHSQHTEIATARGERTDGGSGGRGAGSWQLPVRVGSRGHDRHTERPRRVPRLVAAGLTGAVSGPAGGPARDR